jgi:hypothetical protein
MFVGPIPSSFMLKKNSLSLAELRWAFEKGVIGAQIVVEAAEWIAAREHGDASIAARLAELRHADLPDVKEILLAVPLDDDIDAIRRKWVWLVLSWLYENQRDDRDVFEKLDDLYADFDYPPDMAAFGPYAPAYQVKGDPAVQREQVVSAWQQYLARAAEEFGQANGS